MYTLLFNIKSRAETRKGVNRAILRATGISDFYPDDDAFFHAIDCGFLWFWGWHFEIWEDSAK